MRFDHLDMKIDMHKFQKVLRHYKEPHRIFHGQPCFELMREGLEKLNDFLTLENYSQKEIELIKTSLLYRYSVFNIDMVGDKNENDSVELYIKDCDKVVSQEMYGMEIVSCSILLCGDTYSHNAGEVYEKDIFYQLPFVEPHDIFRIASVVCDVDMYMYSLDYDIFKTFFLLMENEYANDKKSTTYFYTNLMKRYINLLLKSNVYNTTFARKNWNNNAFRNLNKQIAYMAEKLADNV